MPVIPTVGRWRQEDREVISGYIQSLKSADYTQGTITKNKKEKRKGGRERAAAAAIVAQTFNTSTWKA